MYTCGVCQREFKSYNPNPQFCSLDCHNLAQTASIDFELAVQRYESGMTQLEVAKTFGITQKAITNLFRRNGYQSTWAR